MDTIQKENNLKNIHRIPTEELISFVLAGDISLEEMQATGKLEHEKQLEIKEAIVKKEEKQRKETELWEDCKSANTIGKYEAYLAVYPDGRYDAQAKLAIHEIKDRYRKEKESLIHSLKTSKVEVNIEELERYFKSGQLTEHDLMEAGIIPREKLELFMNPPTFHTSQLTWKDLPDLPENRTDVFFLGVPRSGKSSVLSGLLRTMDKDWDLWIDTDNAQGKKYSDELIKLAKLGYVPEPTSTDVDTVNFISADIKHNNTTYPFNFIEMSGEYFKKAYDNNDIDGTIGAKGYLSNNNRKIIYMFIDYQKEIGGIDINELGDQGAVLASVLDLLEKDGTLEKTDSLQIIVTKSDKMPVVNRSDRSQHVLEFLKENHRSLLNRIKSLAEKYNWNVINEEAKVLIHPFSLGKFYLGKTYDFDSQDSNKLIEIMVQTAQKEKKKSVWGKLRDKL